MVGCLRDCAVVAVACAHASCPRGVGEAPRQRPMEGTTATGSRQRVGVCERASRPQRACTDRHRGGSQWATHGQLIGSGRCEITATARGGADWG
jgi:hypothetical protein